MPIRFQADADLNQVIVSGVVRRVPAIDFSTATSAGLAGLKDQEVLAVAPRDGRVLVTHDQATMPRHFREFLRSQRSSGLIVVPQHLPVGATILFSFGRRPKRKNGRIESPSCRSDFDETVQHCGCRVQAREAFDSEALTADGTSMTTNRSAENR